MITGKLIAGSGDLSEVQSIRMRVFVDEQGFPADEEMDQYDARAVHALLYDDDHNPAATGRLYIDDDGYWRIGRVAVLKEKRGAQLGDLVMRMLLDKALGVGAKHFRLSAQRQAEGFYALYGFTPCGEEYSQAEGFYALYGFTPCGEEYMDHHVPHIDMEATDESIVKAVFTGCRGSQFV